MVRAETLEQLQSVHGLGAHVVETSCQRVRMQWRACMSGTPAWVLQNEMPWVQVQPAFIEAVHGRPGSKQVVAYHFHPVLPVVLCLLHTQQQPLQVCLALRV